MTEYIVRDRVHRDRRIAFKNQAKDVPCVDCQVRYPPWVMQFDHRENETKLFTIAKHILTHMAIAKIEQEIAKCDVVCANCHAERTHKRQFPT